MTCGLPGCAGRCRGRQIRPEVVGALEQVPRLVMSSAVWPLLRDVGGCDVDDLAQDVVVLALHTERMGGASSWDPDRGPVGHWVRMMVATSLGNRRRSVMRQSAMGNDARRESYAEEG